MNKSRKYNEDKSPVGFGRGPTPSPALFPSLGSSELHKGTLKSPS